jgi:hypothetical protein
MLDKNLKERMVMPSEILFDGVVSLSGCLVISKCLAWRRQK